MDETPKFPDASPSDARRDHLRLVPDPLDEEAAPLARPTRPRTIGRLIAQTALIADSAVTRRSQAFDGSGEAQGARFPGRLLGRFR